MTTAEIATPMVTAKAATGGVSSVHPFQAVVFYSKTGQKEAMYATVHDVQVTDTGPVLKAGAALTVEAVKEVAKQFGGMLKRSPELIQENVLFTSDEILMWWTPPQIRFCWFDVDWHKDKKGRDRLQNVSGNMPIPSLLWVLKRSKASGVWQGVYVYGLAGTTRPTETTKMYRAPLLNINEDGCVCWGNGKIPSGRTQRDIPEWMNAFFDSTFSHFNQGSPFKKGRGYDLVADLLESEAKSFPVEVMKPMEKHLSTLRDVLTHHLKDSHE